MKILQTVFLFMFLNVMALAETIVLPDGKTIVIPENPNINDVFNIVVEAVKAMKGASGIVIAILVLVILISFLKSNIVGNWFGTKTPIIKRLILVVLGQALSVLVLISTGVVWYTSLWLGLVISGGAILVFEVLGPIFPSAASVFNIIIKILGFFKKA